MIELYLNPDQEGAWEEKESEQGTYTYMHIGRIYIFMYDYI
jgi:hypothetical protein